MRDRTIVQAMRRIGEDGASYPEHMEETMRAWERQGLVEIKGGVARLTDAGRRVAQERKL